MKPKTVDEYIDLQDEDKKEQLQQIRELILSTVPKAEEQVSYMVPYYKYYFGLVGFGAQKKGCSFYTMNSKMPEAFKSELTGYKFSASTIHINSDQKLPKTVLKKIIKARMKENEYKAALKKKKS
ncbi:MAG: DUF1801 domain-containing protein [Crocinitomicaceae bacterium]|nr:DUF1801 domain-containing protein [Crocinitomicaceae bacterium]